MSDELTSLGGDNQSVEEPSSSTPETPTEIARLSRENQKWRTQLRETQAQLKELQPLAEQFKAAQEAQKTEAQKLADQVAAANKLAADNQAAAERAQKELQVTRLATKAGADLDLIPYLDLSKLDLTDEKAALEVLGKLAAARQTAGGASNPGRSGGAGPSEVELQQLYFGGGRNKPTIFGGN